jgi:hypothetical protein
MTRRQLLTILLALAIVGSAGLILVKRGQDTWAVREAKAGDKVLPNFRYNDVAAIHIKGAAEFHIVQQDGEWRIPERDGYPANYQYVRNLLFKIRDLKVVQSERVGPSQLPRVDLAAERAILPRIGGEGRGENPPKQFAQRHPEPPLRRTTGEDSPSPWGEGRGEGESRRVQGEVHGERAAPSSMVSEKQTHQGTLIEFSDSQGKLLDSLLLGKMHLRHEEGSVPRGLHGLFDGRYILLPSDPENVLLISDDLAVVAPEPGAWLSKEFFKIENIQSVSLISPEPGRSWSISRDAESRPWTLMDAKSDAGEVLDAAAASEVAEMFHYLTFADISPKAASAIEKPTILTVLTFDRFAYTIKVGARKDDGNYPLAIAVSADESNLGGAENAKKLRDRLAREKSMAQWVYIVEPQIIEVLLRDRARLLQKKSLAGS